MRKKNFKAGRILHIKSTSFKRMDRFAKYLLPLVVLALSGCGGHEEETTSAAPLGNYIGYVSNNRFFRVNTLDGSTVEYIDGKLVPIAVAPFKLETGKILEDECGELLRYQGNLEFSPVTKP